jgi:hypothetical protein
VDLTVFRNRGALPRMFVPTAVVESADPLASFTRTTDARVVAIDSGPGAARVFPARVSIVSYDSNGEGIRVESAAESFIATSEPALAGWRLERDGERWPLVIVNGIFLGWHVPAGGGTFTLRYRPRGLMAGSALALIGFVGLVTLLARHSGRPRASA